MPAFPICFVLLLAGTQVILLSEELPLEALAAALQQDQHFSLLKITPTQLEVINHLMPETKTEGRIGLWWSGRRQYEAMLRPGGSATRRARCS